MLTRNLRSVNLSWTQVFAFAAKKQKMELTIRTPYRTLFENFEGFSRVITKTNEAALIIQNRSPPSLHILPPGVMKVKLTTEAKGVSGDFMHLGGWVVIHPDNTCEINLLDAYDKGTVKPDQFDKVSLPKEKEDLAGKYVSKLRKTAAKIFLKKSI